MTHLEVARQNIATAVAHCGRKDIQFNALADADPVQVVRDRRASAMKRMTTANRATVQACDEWLAANT
jgi:hypothetical protein